MAQLAAALRDDGWCALPDLFDGELVRALRTDLLELRPEFRAAAVGRGQARQQSAAVRSDATLWLDGRSAAQREFLAAMDEIRLALNQQLYLGLFSYEAHYAHYAPGAFYQRHLDTFRAPHASRAPHTSHASADQVPVDQVPAGQASTARAAATGPRRVLSTVFYLNDDWCDADGGELLLWMDETGEPVRVWPRSGSAVFFLSDAVPHEVRPARVDRYSIAGWFRTQGESVR